ncbi:hypothetical protein BDR04DRAFT_1087066 [Suillus decipiens]|nr:hypothetical protein BDR04DRAFT_1087066 [Suillus decipiens]
MVKSKQLHQTQQEKVQKAHAKLVEDHRAGNTPNIRRTAGQGDSLQPQVCALGRLRRQHALKKKGRRRRQHSSRKLEKQLLELFAMLVVLQ